MVYIDETGAVLDSVDLKTGYLVDEEWIDHPEVEEVGHYEYEEIGRREYEDETVVSHLQRYVVDVPYSPAYREVTVQRYIPYTQEELEILGREEGYGVRINALEAKTTEHDDALNALIGGVADA